MKILYGLLILFFICNISYAKRLDEMNANTSPDITNDFIYSQDVSDTSEASTGTGKSLTIKNLLKAGKITVDGTNVGINSVNPTQQLDVIGTVKATAFIGDGSGLTGVSGSGASVSDDVYGAGWDGDTTTAPSKNSVYDKIQTIGSGSSGSANAAYTVCASDASSNESCDYTCDGTNDQSEIQTAINLATALPYGGKVLLTDGHFNIESSIIPKSNVWLQGSGWQTVLLGTTALANTAVIEDSTTYSPSSPLINFQITDLKIDGSGMSRTGYNVGRKAIFVTYLSKVVFKNLYLYNTPATCMGADFFYDGIIDGNIVDSCGTAGQAYNVGSNGIGVGTRGSSGYEDEPLIIVNNIAKNVANKGIMVEAQDSATSPRHTIISNNLAYDNKDGFSIAGSLHITFTGNESWGNSQDGVWVEAEKRNGSTLTWTNIIIANNNVHDNGGDGFEVKDESSTDFIFTGNISESNSGVGLKIKPTRSIVSNNIISTNGLEGVYMNIGTAGKNMKISNNIISNNGTLGTSGSNDGIHVKTTGVAWDGLQINNNSILDSQGVPTQRYGVFFENASGGTLTNVHLLDNYFSGNTAGTILNSAFASTNFTSMITAGGNFGIGTFTTPTAKLDVYGTVNATAFTGDGSALTGITGGSVGIGTANTITFWPTTTTIGSLPTATYPSLTELSYVKDVTSAIQTQLNAKDAVTTAGDFITRTANDFDVDALDEDDMVSNSAVHLATQQSIKAYVDTAISGVSGGAGGWTDGGTNVYTTTTTDKVGIGTTTPFSDSMLTVKGSTATGTDDFIGLFVQNGVTPDVVSLPNVAHRSVFVQGDGGAYIGGRDVTNDIEFLMGTSTLGIGFGGTSSNHPFDLRSNNTARIRLGTDGNVGIGTITPNARVTVFGTGTGATPIQTWKNSGNTQRMVVMDNGTVGIGTAAPGETLDVSGVIRATSFKGDGSALTGVGSGGWVDGGTNVYVSPTTDNVGIGTTTPSTNFKADIRGNLYVSGNVGIGTLLPRGTLDLGPTGTVYAQTFTGPTGPTILGTANNVGIGTITAGSLLTVGSTGQATVTSAGVATLPTPNLTGKIDINNVAVNDDDCTGEQGLLWYDSTDSAFEFCKSNSGSPERLGQPAPPAQQVIAAGNTIAADACGTFKDIGADGAVTTSTTNTFTAPSADLRGCCMNVVNTSSNAITLDNNATFFSAGAADVVLGLADSAIVCTNGTVWAQMGGSNN